MINKGDRRLKKISKNKIINSYAKAWLDATVSLNIENNVQKEIEALEKSLKENPSLWFQLLAKKEETTEVMSVIKYISQKLKFTSITKNTLLLMVENARLVLLPQVLEEWQKLYNKQNSIVEVEVKSVKPLTPTQSKKLKEVLEKKIKQKVKIKSILNPDVLGGLCISFGSYQIDDTLEAKLKSLQKIMEGKVIC